ncbi:MAG: hypothetical protein ACYCO4_04865 [Sulfobacillus sp.]
MFGYNRADVQAYLAELEGSERAALEIWTRALELERDAVSRARERAMTMRDLLHHLERETVMLEAQVSTAKSSAELLDVGAQHEIYRLEQIYQLRREQLAQLVPAIDRERQKIDQGLRQMMATIRDTMLQTTATIQSGIDHDAQFAAVAPVLFGSELDASQVTARPLPANRTRLDVPPDRLRVQGRDGKLSGSVTGIVVTGLPPRVLGYIVGSTDEAERALPADDVVAIGQHTVMVKPDARLMNLEDLPEVPEGQALRAVTRLAAPDLESIGQAAAALAEASSPGTVIPRVTANDLVAPAAGLDDQPHMIPPEVAPAQPPAREARSTGGTSPLSQSLPEADKPVAPTPAASPAELAPKATDEADRPQVTPAEPPESATQGSDAQPTTAPDPGAGQSTLPTPPEMATADADLAATAQRPIQATPPTATQSSTKAAQVAQAVPPRAAPSLAELAGLLPPPSWQVDVPAPVAGSDLLAETGTPLPVPPPMTLESVVPPAAPPVMPAAPVSQAPNLPSPPPAPVLPPPTRPEPTPEMGAASSGGAVDVLAFLEGKVVGQDIYNSAGELLAAKDMMIDAALVQRVDAAGRLPELIVYMTFPGLGGPGA